MERSKRSWLLIQEVLFTWGHFFATDYDADGDIDLLAGAYDLPTIQGTASNGAVVAYLNDGNANFTPQPVLGGRTFIAARVQAGDMNGDGGWILSVWQTASTLTYHQAPTGWWILCRTNNI